MNFINIRTSIMCYNKDKILIGAGIFTSNNIDIRLKKDNIYELFLYNKESGTYAIEFKNESTIGADIVDKMISLLIHCAKSGEMFEIKVRSEALGTTYMIEHAMRLIEINFKGVE